jgi:hypothetical protein
MNHSRLTEINVDLKPFEFRQGDVLLVLVKDLPADLEDVTPRSGRVVLQHGEATGHAHAFYDRGVKVFAPKGSPKGARPTYLQVVRKTALLKHEEHSPASIPPGIYRMPTQVEHTDEDEPRVVAD